MANGSLVERFGAARRDPALAVLEGLHPLKHALHFDAAIDEVVTSGLGRLEELADELAPDVADHVVDLAREVAAAEFDQLSPHPPATGVVAIARRPTIDLGGVLLDHRPAPIVLLEDPRSLGNLGACVRVCAAAGVAGVLTTGELDPWHPDALRGAAGLQFALPVARIEGPPDSERPLVVFDPGGEPLRPERLPARALLAFGSERQGVSTDLLARADARVSLPMRKGVSSLNLATAVAAALFAWRLSGTNEEPLG